MTQREAILTRLESGAGITPIDALRDFGCFRLAARIGELRAEGYEITTDSPEKGKQFAVYRLKKRVEQAELF